MPETIIGLFQQDQQAQEIIPLLVGQGFEQNNIDVISGRDQSAASGSDLIGRLSRLGVADMELRHATSTASAAAGRS